MGFHSSPSSSWWPRWHRAGPLPGLIIPGAMKAGTTSLFRYLEGHPQLAPAPRKEVHYFDRHFHRGPDWYRLQFPPPSRHRGRAGDRL